MEGGKGSVFIHFENSFSFFFPFESIEILSSSISVASPKHSPFVPWIRRGKKKKKLSPLPLGLRLVRGPIRGSDLAAARRRLS